MAKCLCTLFILCSLALQSQKLIRRYDPNLLNQFQAGQEMQNNLHRIFSSTSSTNYWLSGSPFITDWQIHDHDLQTWNVLDNTFGYPIMQGAYQLFLLELPNDDVILVSNSFECDFGWSDIAYVQSDQKTKWVLFGFDIEPYLHDIVEIGLVDKDVLALISSDGSISYVDFEGVLRTFQTDPPIYTHILYLEDAIFGYQSQRLVHLDTSFQEIHAIEFDSISFVAFLDTSILVQKSDKLILLDRTLNVMGENAEIKHIQGATSLTNQFAVINDENLFILNSDLQVTQQYASLPWETFKYIAIAGDTVFLWTEYDGIRHSDFVVRQYILNEETLVPSLDLAISNLVLPDTTYVDLPLGTYWFIQLRFDTIFFDITNNSTDTIYNFLMECDWSGDFQCTDFQRSWAFNDLHLDPGSTQTLRLNPFYTDTIPYAFHSPFCFWVESPNGLPDPDPSNNYACDGTRLTTAIEEVNFGSQIHIYPNPCDTELEVVVDDHQNGEWKCLLFSMDGRILFQMPLALGSNKMSMEHYASGFYVLQLTDQSGRSKSNKLLIHH